MKERENKREILSPKRERKRIWIGCEKNRKEIAKGNRFRESYRRCERMQKRQIDKKRIQR